jgi:trehalose 2-sulfotransferase
MQIFVPTTPDENEHLRHIEAHFGQISAGPVTLPRGLRFIFLCYTNRCGSDYVAQSIASDGRLNVAEEFFNHETVVFHARRERHKDIQAYFDWLVRYVKIGRRVMCKLAVNHLEILGRAGIMQQIIERSHFILVERSDKLGQAISYDIARQTGQWNSRIAAQQTAADIEFSAARLTAITRSFAEQYQAFGHFFSRNAVAPTHIVYEDFVADPQSHLERIGRNVSFPDLRMLPQNIWLQKQAGPLNLAWRERYLRDRTPDSRAARFP